MFLKRVYMIVFSGSYLISSANHVHFMVQGLTDKTCWNFLRRSICVSSFNPHYFSWLCLRSQDVFSFDGLSVAGTSVPRNSWVWSRPCPYLDCKCHKMLWVFVHCGKSPHMLWCGAEQAQTAVAKLSWGLYLSTGKDLEQNETVVTDMFICWFPCQCLQ